MEGVDELLSCIRCSSYFLSDVNSDKELKRCVEKLRREVLSIWVFKAY
jgi:hypothetical protein